MLKDVWFDPEFSWRFFYNHLIALGPNSTYGIMRNPESGGGPGEAPSRVIDGDKDVDTIEQFLLAEGIGIKGG